jgi:hypothetical protein
MESALTKKLPGEFLFYFNGCTPAMPMQAPE